MVSTGQNWGQGQDVGENQGPKSDFLGLPDLPGVWPNYDPEIAPKIFSPKNLSRIQLSLFKRKNKLDNFQYANEVEKSNMQMQL